MKGKDQELVPLVFACVVVGFEVHHQSLESHWNQMSNNPLAFYIWVIWLQQRHKKIANSFGSGSTHVVGPQDPKCLQ